LVEVEKVEVVEIIKQRPRKQVQYIDKKVPKKIVHYVEKNN